MWRGLKLHLNIYKISQYQKKKVIISFNGADCLKKAEWRQRIPVDSGSRYLFFESLMDYMHRFDKFTWTFISYMQVYVTVFQKDAMSPI